MPSYTDPQVNTEQVIPVGITVAGTGTYNHFKAFNDATLLEARAVVMTAGTATAFVVDILNGTTSLGQISLSTNTAGSWADASLTDVAIDADDIISCEVVGDDTGVAKVYLQLKDLPA